MANFKGLGDQMTRKVPSLANSLHMNLGLSFGRTGESQQVRRRVWNQISYRSRRRHCRFHKFYIFFSSFFQFTSNLFLCLERVGVTVWWGVLCKGHVGSVKPNFSSRQDVPVTFPLTSCSFATDAGGTVYSVKKLCPALVIG